MASDIDATAWGEDGSQIGALSASTRTAVAEWASSIDAVQVLLAKGDRRERWTRPATDAPWRQAGRWEHDAAQEARNASRRVPESFPSDSRPIPESFPSDSRPVPE